LQVHKTNINKQRLFLALSKDFSAGSALSSEIIASSLDRQFDDTADLADLSAANLDRTVLFDGVVNSLYVAWSYVCGGRFVCTVQAVEMIIPSVRLYINEWFYKQPC